MTSEWKASLGPMFSRITGCETLNYSHIDFGRDTTHECMSVILKEASAIQKALAVYFDDTQNEAVDADDADFDIEDIQAGERLAYSCLSLIRSELPKGYVAFMGTTNWLGPDINSGIEIVVGPGNNQFDIVRLARTDACNYDLSTEDIIRRLQQYDNEFGIDIFHAETDLVEFDLRTAPRDPAKLAADLYDFCPDLIDQGMGDLEDLAQEILEEKRVTLWWD